MGSVKSPQPVNKQRQSLLTTYATRARPGANILARSCGVLLYKKVIGFAKLRNLLDMKIIEIVKINRELLRNLHIAGVRLDDTNYIDLYTEYRRMLLKREKVSYIVAALAVKYAISERKVYALIKRFQTDCNLFAV